MNGLTGKRVGARNPRYELLAALSAARPRTSHVTADFTNSTADGVTWVDIPGLNVTHRPTGPDVEVELRTVCTTSGSAGYRYQFRVVRDGSDPKFLGTMSGSANNLSSFVGVAKYTQLTPGLRVDFKVQVKVGTGGGSFNIRSATFPDREFAVIKVTDVAYP